MVTSDFRPEVEIRPFRASAMHSAIMGTIRSLWTWLWGRYHVPQNVFLVYASDVSSVSRLRVSGRHATVRIRQWRDTLVGSLIPQTM